MKKHMLFFLCVSFILSVMAFAGAEDAPLIRINEVLSSSSSHILQDENGNSPDWIEIYNAGKEDISLAGFCLTDNEKRLDKFVFPDVILPAGGYQLVLCSGEERITEREMHASFKLSADGEQILLSCRGQIVDQVDTGRQAQDISLARNAAGVWEKTHCPTPGRENEITALTQARASSTAPAIRGGVQLNEVMASASDFRDRPGYDYVELFNDGPYQNLSGWSITLNGKEERAYVFPSGTGISQGEYLVVYFTTAQSNKLNAGFPISSSYGTLTLRNPAGQVMDVLSWDEPLYGNLPYGRPANSSAFCFLETETRGSRNPSTGYMRRADAPQFSVDAGFYAAPFTVELEAGDGETIYYTLDGSTPTRQSRLYTGPLSIQETTVLRAAAGSDFSMLSEIASATYFIGLDMPIPVVSVMIDDAYFDDPITGMMAKGNYEKDWEYPANIEYFTPDGTRTLGQLAGVSVSGEVSRRYSQKSMVFFARKAYGNGEFAFNPFPHRDYESVQAFVLRNAGSEGAADGVRFMDLFLTRLALYSHALVSDGQPVLVFINGEVWGHCNIRERVNKDYFAAHEGITDEDVIDAIDILNADGVASNGSAADYHKLSRYMETTNLNQPGALDYVLSQLDVDSLFDYAAYEMICGNRDLSNTRFYRVPGGKWTWVLYDLDTAMNGTGSAPIGYFMQPLSGDPIVQFDHVPFAALMKVPEMKDQFLRRMGEIMAEHFTYASLSAELDLLRGQMAPAMEYHLVRWPAINMQKWYQNVETLRKTLKNRPPQVVKDVQVIFHLTDQEVQLYFGDFLKKNSR